MSISSAELEDGRESRGGELDPIVVLCLSCSKEAKSDLIQSFRFLLIRERISNCLTSIL